MPFEGENTISGIGTRVSLGRKALEVLRISYTLPFVLASLTGVVFALTERQEWLVAICIPLDVFFLAMFVNLSNDYFDHKSGVDAKRFSVQEDFMQAAREVLPPSFYWSGNSFDMGLISERSGRILLLSLAAAAVIIAVPIILYGGWIVLVLGMIGFFLSYFYTAPPLNLGARGLGELDVALSFTFISFFSYYVILQKFSPEMLIVAVCVGLCMGMVRIVDEMSGYDAHVQMGEKNLCVIFGIDGAARIVTVLITILYILCSSLLLFDIIYLLLFLTLPNAVRTVRYLGDRTDRLRVIRPVPEIFKVAVGIEILVIISLIVRTALTSV